MLSLTLIWTTLFRVFCISFLSLLSSLFLLLPLSIFSLPLPSLPLSLLFSLSLSLLSFLSLFLSLYPFSLPLSPPSPSLSLPLSLSLSLSLRCFSQWANGFQIGSRCLPFILLFYYTPFSPILTNLRILFPSRYGYIRVDTSYWQTVVANKLYKKTRTMLLQDSLRVFKSCYGCARIWQMSLVYKPVFIR